jgi:hypothetical protein
MAPTNQQIAAAAFSPERHRHIRRPPADLATPTPRPARDAALARIESLAARLRA